MPKIANEPDSKNGQLRRGRTIKMLLVALNFLQRIGHFAALDTLTSLKQVQSITLNGRPGVCRYANNGVATPALDPFTDSNRKEREPWANLAYAESGVSASASTVRATGI